MKQFEICLLISLQICLESSLGFGMGMGMGIGMGFSRKLRDPIPFPELNPSTDKWFDQKLDHSNRVNGTWKQRYFENTQFYDYFKSMNKTNMPLFLMIGGEGEATPGWLRGGYWILPARQHGALLLLLEHRYYGESHPTADLSLENLRYLTSHQALADLANFIVAMKKKYGMTDKNRVVCFGGSYPGNLAAWIRLKYPKIVHASISSSGPVEAKVDFHEYFEVVEDALSKTSGEECATTIKQATSQMQDMVKTQEGCNNITKLFTLCNTLRADNQLDMQMFFNGQAQQIAGVVQYNQPAQPAVKPKPDNFQIVDVCAILMDENEPDPLKRFINLNDAFRGQSCVAFSFKGYANALRTSTSWDSGFAKGGSRQWIYQTCNEFGYYQTSNTEDSLFGNTIPENVYTQACREGFSSGYTDQAIYQRIDYTNSVFKGKDASMTNVFYVHGTVDPWHPLGIVESKSENERAVLIEGTSHCADMNTPQSNDLPGLKKAREEITKYLNAWLKQ